MKDPKFQNVLYVRRVFQMSAVTIISVLVISIVIVFATGSTVVVSDCGPVKNANIEEEMEYLVLSWEPPIGPSCIANADIIVNEDPVVRRSSPFRIEKESCIDYNIIIWSLDRTTTPMSSYTIKHTSGISGSGKVLNLRFENNLLEWDRPENAEDCNLEYEVVVDTKNLNPTKLTVSEQYVKLTLIPCSENAISVTSIVIDNGRRGEEATIEERGPVTSKPPIHESTNPDFTGAVVTWHKDEEENDCNFVEIKFYYSQIGTDDEMSVSFDINEYGSYELENLTPNTRYSYRARWILKNTEDGENDEISDHIEFQTTPLSDPHSIDFAIQTEGGIRITWTQDYEVHFITNHEIVVENLGPAHFLPENCQTDKGEIIESVQLDPETDYLVLSNVRPNFNYGITVTTIFGNLGLNTSYNTAITTPIDRPGKIEIIEVNHVYEHGVPYNVKSNVAWNFQCDINGPLKHFDVKISGKFNAPGVIDDGIPDDGNCNVDFFTEIIPGQEQETFKVVTDVLVPFFDYEIIITTVQESQDGQDGTVLEGENGLSSETRKELKDVPIAYTPLGRDESSMFIN